MGKKAKNKENERQIKEEIKAVETLFPKVIEEIKAARRKHKRRFVSYHEAFGVMQEEFEEWWDTVKACDVDNRELISVATMALLAIAELELLGT